MNEGDIALAPLPQADGQIKNRPVVLLRRLPPFGDFLICGISTQLHLLEANWDELIQPSDGDFAGSGLHQPSAIRLSYLYAADATEISGRIGSIDAARLDRLLTRLASHLQP